MGSRGHGLGATEVGKDWSWYPHLKGGRENGQSSYCACFCFLTSPGEGRRAFWFHNLQRKLGLARVLPKTPGVEKKGRLWRPHSHGFWAGSDLSGSEQGSVGFWWEQKIEAVGFRIGRGSHLCEVEDTQFLGFSKRTIRAQWIGVAKVSASPSNGWQSGYIGEAWDLFLFTKWLWASDRLGSLSVSCRLLWG